MSRLRGTTEPVRCPRAVLSGASVMTVCNPCGGERRVHSCCNEDTCRMAQERGGGDAPADVLSAVSLEFALPDVSQSERSDAPGD